MVKAVQAVAKTMPVAISEKEKAEAEKEKVAVAEKPVAQVPVVAEEKASTLPVKPVEDSRGKIPVMPRPAPFAPGSFKPSSERIAQPQLPLQQLPMQQIPQGIRISKPVFFYHGMDKDAYDFIADQMAEKEIQRTSAPRASEDDPMELAARSRRRGQQEAA